MTSTEPAPPSQKELIAALRVAIAEVGEYDWDAIENALTQLRTALDNGGTVILPSQPLADRLAAVLTRDEFDAFTTGMRVLWGIAAPELARQWDSLLDALGMPR